MKFEDISLFPNENVFPSSKDYQKYNQTQITELEMLYQLKVESFRQEVRQDEEKASSPSNDLIEQNRSLEKQFST